MFTLTEKIRFIESVFGSSEIDRGGRNISVICPICRDNEPTKKISKRKLAIRASDDANHCWVCGWKAMSLVALLRKYGTQDDILNYKDKFAPNLKAFTDNDEPVRKDPLKLPEDFMLLAMKQTARDPDIRAALNYLKGRGMSERDLWYFKFGYSSKGFLKRRVIMPSFDAKGKLNFFTARAIDRDETWKYVNPDTECVRPSEVVFNEINIDWSQPINIVEGPFDLTRCPENTTPLLGNQLSENHALFNSILMHDTPVVVMLDSDAAMRASMIAKRFAAYNINVKIASLGQYKDPGEMSPEEVALCIQNAVPWDWANHMKQKLGGTFRLTL